MGRFVKILAFVLVFFLTQSSTFALAETKENRIIFDQHGEWLTREGADRLLDRLSRANFNVLVPCVWMGDGARWPSTSVPLSNALIAAKGANPDPLAYLIERAHRRGIEIHPWFAIGYRVRDTLPEFAPTGTPHGAFDLHSNAFQAFFVAMVGELATGYDVDGINLDYARTLGVCLTEACRSAYFRATGRELEVGKLIRTPAHELRTEHPLDWETIRRWNRETVARLIERVSLAVRNVKPKLVLSVDTNLALEDFQFQGADAISWANNGWIDIIYHMNYSHDLGLDSSHDGAIVSAKRRLKNPDALMILLSTVDWPGNRIGSDGAYSRPADLVANQIADARRRWPTANGIALWTYRYLDDAQIDRLHNGPFATPTSTQWRLRH